MEKQYRNTAQRRTILDNTSNRCDHPSADDIYLSVIKEDPRISRGTVYRNLNLLCEQGLVRHIKVPGGADRFDSRLDDHYHVLCLGCNRMDDVELPYSSELDSQASASCGYDVNGHRTVFEGYCPACRKERGSKDKQDSK